MFWADGVAVEDFVVGVFFFFALILLLDFCKEYCKQVALAFASCPWIIDTQWLPPWFLCAHFCEYEGPLSACHVSEYYFELLWEITPWAQLFVLSCWSVEDESSIFVCVYISVGI